MPLIPASCSFCRTVAERLRQQWHDLALSPDRMVFFTQACSFVASLHTVAERLRQQWHDLALSPDRMVFFTQACSFVATLHTTNSLAIVRVHAEVGSRCATHTHARVHI